MLTSEAVRGQGYLRELWPAATCASKGLQLHVRLVVNNHRLGIYIVRTLVNHYLSDNTASATRLQPIRHTADDDDGKRGHDNYLSSRFRPRSRQVWRPLGLKQSPMSP